MALDPCRGRQKGSCPACEQTRHRVLDVGCGPGKFCVIGAATTKGVFTGIEQRGELVGIARNLIDRSGIPRVQIVHGNITTVDFTDYDAFYIFNPFEENVRQAYQIDATVELKASCMTSTPAMCRPSFRASRWAHAW